MAERLGLLAGPNPSPVAVAGARVLEHVDALAAAEQQVMRVRLALLAAGGDPRTLFAEHFAADKGQESARIEAVDVSEDYDKVTWTVPSADEWTRTQALLADDRVQVPTPDAGWV